MNAPVLNAPRVVRLNAADNVVVAVDPIEAGARRRRASRRAPACRAATRWRRRPIATGPAHPQVRPDHRLRLEAHRAGRLGARAQCRDARLRARLPLRRGRAAGGDPARRRAGDLPGLPPRQRQGRHPQLHRHPHLGELLGHGGALHGRGDQPLRPAGRLSQHRRRHPARAGRRLRARREGRGLRDPQAHAVGLRHQPERRRRGDGGPGLRGLPDRRAGRRPTASRRATPSAP